MGRKTVLTNVAGIITNNRIQIIIGIFLNHLFMDIEYFVIYKALYYKVIYNVYARIN